MTETMDNLEKFLGGVSENLKNTENPFDSEETISALYRGFKEDYDESLRSEAEVIPQGRVLLIGDLHLSSIFKGKHRDYQMECVDVLNKLLDMASDPGVTAVVLMGDVFGVRESFISNPAFQFLVFDVFQKLNELVDGRVFSVRGNHDYGGISTFLMMMKAGVVKNPERLVLQNKSGADVAHLHIVNWGDESKELDVEKGVKNFILGHNAFMTRKQFQDSPLRENDVVILDDCDNFGSVKTVISGHIHTYEEPTSPMTDSGKTYRLFYVGSPTRPNERIDVVKYLSMQVGKAKDGSYAVGLKSHNWDLLPAERVFYPEEAADTYEKPSAVEDELRAVLDQINQGVPQSKARERIETFPGTDPKSREIALGIYDSVNQEVE